VVERAQFGDGAGVVDHALAYPEVDHQLAGLVVAIGVESGRARLSFGPS